MEDRQDTRGAHNSPTRQAFLLVPQGSIVIFEALTPEATAFVLANVDVPSWAWLKAPTVFAVDHRPARDLVRILTSEGLPCSTYDRRDGRPQA